MREENKTRALHISLIDDVLFSTSACYGEVIFLNAQKLWLDCSSENVLRAWTLLQGVDSLTTSKHLFRIGNNADPK